MNSKAESEDRLLGCVDCGDQFIWTSGEQAFFAEQGFTNPPRRCKTCRLLRKQRLGGGKFRREKGGKK